MFGRQQTRPEPTPPPEATPGMVKGLIDQLPDAGRLAVLDHLLSSLGETRLPEITGRLNVEDLMHINAMLRHRFSAPEAELSAQDSASPEASQTGCGVKGSAIMGVVLDPRVKPVLDKYFTKIEVSFDWIKWELKDAFTPREIVTEIDRLNREIHGMTLLPLADTARAASDYDSKESPGIVEVDGYVSCTRRLDYGASVAKLDAQDMELCPRRYSIMALNLTLLLTGQDNLLVGRRLRDDTGVLTSEGKGLESDDSTRSRAVGGFDGIWSIAINRRTVPQQGKSTAAV